MNNEETRQLRDLIKRSTSPSDRHYGTSVLIGTEWVSVSVLIRLAQRAVLPGDEPTAAQDVVRYDELTTVGELLDGSLAEDCWGRRFIIESAREHYSSDSARWAILHRTGTRFVASPDMKVRQIHFPEPPPQPPQEAAPEPTWEEKVCKFLAFMSNVPEARGLLAERAAAAQQQQDGKENNEL